MNAYLVAALVFGMFASAMHIRSGSGYIVLFMAGVHIVLGSSGLA